MVLEPVFERDFAVHSYGFRPNLGCKDALRRVDALLKDGLTWVVEVDIKSYFDSIPHDQLMTRLGEKIADGRVLDLVRGYLTQQVMTPTAAWTPTGGTPQGAVISPLLSNVYLDPLDHRMERAGYAMTRYADDFVIQCRTQAEAEQVLDLVRTWLTDAGLTLHPDKTRIVDAAQPGGFDFLGYHFERDRKWPARKSLAKFKERIRQATKRTSGHALTGIIADLNRTLRGWFEYFKHSYRTTFPSLDAWIRGRLRSLLRRRQGRRGRACGDDHHRWPNAFFAHHGLFSLVTAHAQLVNPLGGKPSTGEPDAGNPPVRFGGGRG
jgi:RNA-directed DNA polymerase